MSEYEERIIKECGRTKVKGLSRILAVLVALLLFVPSVLAVFLSVRLYQTQKELDYYKGENAGNQVSQALASDPGATLDGYGDIKYVNKAGFEKTEYIDNDNAENGDLGYNTLGVDTYEGYIKVCLTFDDGPSSRTDEILDILDEYGIKATFFVNGKEGYDEQYRRIVNEGHSIGLHSYSHLYRELYQSLDSFAEDLYKEQSFIKELTGADTVLYRFPGGSSNQVSRVDMQECINYLTAKGIVYYDWNASAQDAVAGGATTTQIVNNILSPIRSGSEDTYIVLMHDAQDKRTTVEALPIIIEQLAAMENVMILPIDEGITPVQHVKAVSETVIND